MSHSHQAQVVILSTLDGEKPYCMYIHRGGSSLKWDFHTIEVGISHLYICSVASLQNLPVLQYIREHGYKYATALQEVVVKSFQWIMRQQ